MLLPVSCQSPASRENPVLSQQHISPQTPIGATLQAGGATFKVWAPAAKAVYLHGGVGRHEFDQTTAEPWLQKEKKGDCPGVFAGAHTAGASRGCGLGGGEAG